MSHDQNFKNLIVDYPHQAVQFFAADEAAEIDERVRIIPVRQEQLKERLGDRFRELDVPLLLEWPDARRAAVLFAFEEETATSKFSIHRLAHYCLDLAELFETERVVLVAVFLRLKYADFVDIYANLSDSEREQYERDYPEETKIMQSFSTRMREEGERIGEQRGIQLGEANMLLLLLEEKFGAVPEQVRAQVVAANPESLLRWSRRLLKAESIDDVLR